MSNRWPSGSTTAWRKIRTLVLDRDAHRCQLRIPDICTTIATQAHHTKARELVGDDPTYLVAACQPCNQRVGDPTRHDPPPRPSRW